MRVIKIVGVLFLVFAFAVVGGGYMLPYEVYAQRQIVINAPPEKVFPHVNDLKKFNEWSPWAQIDPNTQYRFEGPDSGLGQKMHWSSSHEQVGNGSQEIVESVPNQKVTTALKFGDMGDATASMDLQPSADGKGTAVTWGFKTDLGKNPIWRWMGLMVDDWVGTDYEKGLANLKTKVESENTGG